MTAVLKDFGAATLSFMGSMGVAAESVVKFTTPLLFGVWLHIKPVWKFLYWPNPIKKSSSTSIFRRLHLLEIWREREKWRRERKRDVNFLKLQSSSVDRPMVWCTVLTMCVSDVCVSVCVCLPVHCNCVLVHMCVCVWSKCSYWVWFSAWGGKLNHFCQVHHTER